MRREHGAFIEDGRQVGSSLQCPHCGRHFDQVLVLAPEVCLKCMGLTCGQLECIIECVPFEAQLDHMEGKQTKYTETIIRNRIIL